MAKKSFLASSPRSQKQGPLTLRKLLRAIVTILHDRKAEEIIVLDLRDIATFTDYFVLATALHERHIQALREHLIEQLKIQGVHPASVEGIGTTWNILDFQEVIVHLFTAPTRKFYDLENLWMDARRIPLKKLLPPQPYPS